MNLQAIWQLSPLPIAVCPDFHALHSEQTNLNDIVAELPAMPHGRTIIAKGIFSEGAPAGAYGQAHLHHFQSVSSLSQQEVCSLSFNMGMAGLRIAARDWQVL